MGTQAADDTELGTPRLSGPLQAAIVVAVAVIVAVPFAGIAIRGSASITAWDLSVLQGLESVRSPVLEFIALGMSRLFSPAVSVALVILAAVGVWVLRREVWASVMVVVLTLVPWLGNSLIKAIVHRPRPDSGALPNHLLTATGYSYPSGHTSFAVAFCLALVIVLGSGRWRAPLIVVASVVPVLTAFARMYVGVHYLTDVLASLLYATAATVIVYAALVASRPRAPSRR